MFFTFLPVLVILVWAVVYFQRHPDAPNRARFLRRLAFGLMAFVTVFFAAFVVGETFADPGGLAAIGLIASWLVPLVGLAALSWWWPGVAGRVLTGLCAVLLAVTVWAAVQSDSWRSFEDDHGPVRTVAAFALSAAIAVYGLRRPRPAGWLLVTLGAATVVLSGVAGRLAPASMMAALTPGLIAGVIYLLAAHLDGEAIPDSPRRPDDRLGVG